MRRMALFTILSKALPLTNMSLAPSMILSPLSSFKPILSSGDARYKQNKGP